MKQEKHIDMDAMLRGLPEAADKAMGGLEATPFLKARIDRAVNEKKQGKVRFAIPRWAPAMCCAAVVVVLALTFMPMQQEQPGTLIDSGMLGNPTAAPQGVLTADLRSGDVIITSNNAKPGYRSFWAETKDGSFPIIGISGKYYRMLTNPTAVPADMLGDALVRISEFTTEPSLSGTDAVMSNAASSGAWVYEVAGLSADTVVAAEVNGRMRLFQRVSFNGNALRGKEKLTDVLALEGKVIALELTGVGTVTNPDAAQALMATLLDCAEYESSGSITTKKALVIELDNGLVLQMNVKGDRLAGCGVWSCPEFFEAFDDMCD